LKEAIDLLSRFFNTDGVGGHSGKGAGKKNVVEIKADSNPGN